MQVTGKAFASPGILHLGSSWTVTNTLEEHIGSISSVEMSGAEKVDCYIEEGISHRGKECTMRIGYERRRRRRRRWRWRS
jgi:hypothetical protein